MSSVGETGPTGATAGRNGARGEMAMSDMELLWGASRLERRLAFCTGYTWEMGNGKWTAFIKRFPNQWSLKVLYNSQWSPVVTQSALHSENWQQQGEVSRSGTTSN